MESMNIILLLVACLSFSTFVHAPPPPGYVVGENFGECQIKSDDLVGLVIDCWKVEFSQDQLNETSEMYNGTSCVQCKHLCRKKTQVKDCIRTGVNLLKDISNKSKYMVPFIAELSETSINAICEYEEEVTEAERDTDRQCIKNSWNSCKSHLEFVRYMEAVAFCDSGNPETDPYTMEYICQKVGDFTQCTENHSAQCSINVINFMRHLRSKLGNAELCANNQ